MCSHVVYICLFGPVILTVLCVGMFLGFMALDKHVMSCIYSTNKNSTKFDTKALSYNKAPTIPLPSRSYKVITEE